MDEDWIPPDQPKPHIELDSEQAELVLEQLFAKEYASAHTLQRARTLAHELAKRRVEALQLYRALPEQQRFHRCRSPYRLVRGSNRAGKTLSAAVEVARAVTGQDPFGKFPARDGTAFIVGKDLKHIGKVLYAKLFRPGAFKIIRDKDTGRWREYRPWTEDAEREQEARYAPPLVPKRLIAEIAWENKKENVPSVVRLTNGWELYFFSSLGKPPQGSPIDLFWFDEEIIDPNWYPEMAARVVDRKGRGIWSATPQAGTDQLYELHEKAEKERTQQADPDRRRINEFVVLLGENRHISEAAKKAFAEDLSDEEARVRVGGEYAITSYKVYPGFSMLVHGHSIIEVPQNWTRYAYVDPGHRTCAVLFAAVPPPRTQDFEVLLYDELYLRETNAVLFAEAMKRATDGQVFQAFLIDAHMAIHTEMGIGKTVMQQYSEALAAKGVRSQVTGSSFLFASDDVSAGVLAVLGLLRVGEKGKPKLRVMEQKLPNFEYEIKRYHRKRVAGVVQEAPDQKKDNHLMDCLRYLAMHGPRYVTPKEAKPRGAGSLESYRRKMDRRRERDGGPVTHLGPGSRL